MKNLLLATGMIALVLALNSCMEANGPELNKAISSPSNIEIVMSRNTLTASWEFSEQTSILHFVTQLSGNSNFNSIIRTDTVASDKRELVYENVAVNAEYYFRIKAIKDNRAKSSLYASQSLQLESVLQSVERDNLTGSSAVLTWSEPASGTVTELVLTPDEGSPVTIQLNDQHRSNNSITADNLSSFTLYSAAIYDGDLRKGATTFRTYDVNGRITINGGGTSYRSLQQAIDEASGNDEIHIQGKHDFNSTSAIAISKPLTIQAASSSNEMPEIYFSAFELSGNVGTLELSGLKLIGSGNHTVNVSAAQSAEVTMTGNDISGFESGIIYASSNAADASYGLTVDNTLIHDIGNTGGDFIDFRAGTITTLDIQNSTFWNLARTFFRVDEGVTYTGEDPPLFTHCTVDNVASAPFVSIHSESFKLHINNSVLTNKKSDESNSFGIPMFAYADNNNTFGINQGAYIEFFDYWTDEATISNIVHEDPQYADPANGDFTVGNQTLIDAELGDPRWLP